MRRKPLGAKQRREVKSILLVLGAAVSCAILLSAYMLYFYGPTGRYIARNTLLSPQVAQEMSYSDLNPQTGQQDRFILSGMEFSYWNAERKIRERIQVNADMYAHFYDRVSAEKSLETPVGEGIVQLFNPNLSSSLMVNVRASSQPAAHSPVKTFQVIQFAPNGDYYRIQLIGQSVSGEWAYFYHPAIYQETLLLFTKKS
jgi:hypothetical protein